MDGRDYHFLTPEEFDRRVEAGDFLEHASYSGNRYGTLRSEVERRLAAGRSVVLEIEVQGARQVRDAMPEAVLIFIAPPDPAALRERLEGRGTDSRRGDRAAAADGRGRAGGTGRVPARGGERRRAEIGLGAGEARPRRAVPTLTSMSMIKPRVDKLLEQTDTHYAAVVVAAKRARQINAYYHSLSEGAYGEYTPPMVEVPSGNYLTIALEETAQGKLKYEYKA